MPRVTFSIEKNREHIRGVIERKRTISVQKWGPVAGLMSQISSWYKIRPLKVREQILPVFYDSALVSILGAHILNGVLKLYS
ncbi:MAG: hypothetical protein ACI89U_001983, partial [Gammaproteobacteria bacterium]